MNTRKTILSAMSVMASMMMFATESSEVKGENDRREQNQAIIAGLKTDLKPAMRKDEVDPALIAANEAMFMEAIKRYEEEQAKRHQKPKGTPWSVYAIWAVAAVIGGLAAAKAGEEIGTALRKKWDGRTV